MPGSYAWRSEDHARPPCQSHVGVVLQAPADRAVAFALLTLFQLLQQTKIARNFNWKEEKWEETERFWGREAAAAGKEGNPRAAAARGAGGGVTRQIVAQHRRHFPANTSDAPRAAESSPARTVPWPEQTA